MTEINGKIAILQNPKYENYTYVGSCFIQYVDEASREYK